MEQKVEKVKTKVRFTSLDVAAMVSNMQSFIGMRATNIYDLKSTTYSIKLAKSEEKTYLLIENGIRFHTTEQKPDKNVIPSGFTMKFRKFLRSKRLEGVRQVGVERVVVFTFGSEAFTNHLILELYAQGNIILTDNNYRILQCIRSHEFNDKVKTAVGEVYPFQYAANIYLENLIVNQQKVNELLDKEQKAQQQPQQNAEGNQKKKKNKNKNKGPTKLKDLVFKLIPCLFPLVIEHILLSKNKNPEQKVSSQNKQLIIEGGKICLQFLKDYLKSKHEGYLFQKPPKQGKQTIGQQPKQVEYFQFSSYKNIKYQNYPIKHYKTFNESVNQYFLKYKKTVNQQQEQFGQVAWKKYEQIKKDQDQRVKKLQQQQDIYKVKAEYIEKNVEDVDAIIKIIKTMQDNGYSWEDISRMIAESKKNGDPLANTIHEMNIYKRLVVVLLGDPVEEEQNFQLLPVQINIDYNAYTNATMYYESKKKNFQKELRTKQASQQVLKIAEKDAIKKIQKKKNQVFAKNIPQRKVFWFEKFNWFVTSEGYLVISGRDSHQNELVVKRYMKAGDLYMHSDYGGAASTVIKKHRKDVQVPRNTLQQAAIFTVCRSKAWQTKILSGAWWVYHDQVSKSAPTGEFLPTGSFMIRGKRNFIQPNRMQMGVTLLFKVDNQSAQRHLNDRRIHEQQMKKQEEQEMSSKDRYIMKQGGKTQEEQFAIISIDMQTKKQRQEQMKQEKLQKVVDYNKKKQQQIRKMDENDSDDNDKGQNSDDNDSGSQQDKKAFEKKPKQQQNVKKQNTNNNKKGQQTATKEVKEQPKQKHKQRKQKKLKKLQKYLQEQDDDERQMIMKMLGAKEMKHMQDPKDQEEEQPVDKKNMTQQEKNKKKKKDKKIKGKKGINKYFDMEEDQEGKEKLNPDKVLFFKKKEQQEQDSQSSEEKKQEEKKQTTKEEGQNILGQQKGQQGEQNQNQGSQQKEQSQPSEPQQEQEEQTKQEGKQQKQQEQQVDEKLLDTELGELYKLVNKPHPEDRIQCLVAMCAPYNSIKENRFKVKLVPGGLKKGKAARNILHFFSNNELSQTEKVLVRSVPEQELINAVIGNSKLAGAGLLKMELKTKNDKKQKRKQQDNNKKKQKD